MASRIEYKRKTATKKNRSKAKGKATRRKVSVKNKGGNVNVLVGKR